jgi:hypothetical protein
MNRSSNPSQWGTILANLFEGAHAAVEGPNTFRWHSAAGEHCDTWKEHSSQALAIDVFGTLKVSEDRDAVLDRLAAQLGLPAGGPWEVTLEWHDPDNLLHEKQPTWVDAVAQSPQTIIFFECKFTENDGGSCSQMHMVRTGKQKGQRPCTGSYMWQTNPANGREARCILTTKGMRYWDVIPQVFDYDAGASYLECPFRGSWFQWMRNLTVCAAVAQHTGLKPAMVVVYADAPGLAMAARVKSSDWERLTGRLQRGVIAFQAMSFQSLTALARKTVPRNTTLAEMDVWVNGKINRVSQQLMERRDQPFVV